MAASTSRVSDRVFVYFAALASSLAQVDIASAQVPAQSAQVAAGAKAVEPQAGRLSFDPGACKYLDRVSKRFELSDSARTMFTQQGLVVLSRGDDATFGGVYHEIYGADLPVLITSDSILHVMHRSFDNLLAQLEQEVYAPAVGRALSECHDVLDSRQRPVGNADRENFQDVDLYLTVARNLLAGAPAGGNRPALPSALGQDERVQQILSAIAGGRLQHPALGQSTVLYGGRRPIGDEKPAPAQKPITQPATTGAKKPEPDGK